MAASAHPIPDEARIIAVVQGGNRAAFSALVRAHQRTAYLVCRAILGVHEDAEDAVQEGFLNAFRSIDRFEPGKPFGAWLHRIMANAARDHRRRRTVRETDELKDDLRATEVEPAYAMTSRDLLASAVAALPPRQRAAMVLHDVEGFTHAEIGGMLGIPEGTVKSDCFHARRRLRARLAQYRDDL